MRLNTDTAETQRPLRPARDLLTGCTRKIGKGLLFGNRQLLASKLFKRSARKQQRDYVRFREGRVRGQGGLDGLRGSADAQCDIIFLDLGGRLYVQVWLNLSLVGEVDYPSFDQVTPLVQADLAPLFHRDPPGHRGVIIGADEPEVGIGNEFRQVVVHDDGPLADNGNVVPDPREQRVGFLAEIGSLFGAKVVEKFPFDLQRVFVGAFLNANFASDLYEAAGRAHFQTGIGPSLQAFGEVQKDIFERGVYVDFLWFSPRVAGRASGLEGAPVYISAELFNCHAIASEVQPDIEVVGGDLGRRETCLTVSELNESGDLGSGQRPSHVDPHLRCAGRSQILCHEGEDPGIHIPFQAKVEGRARFQTRGAAQFNFGLRAGQSKIFYARQPIAHNDARRLRLLHDVVFQLQFELVGGDIRCQRCEIHARRLHRRMEAQDAGDACRKLSRRLKLKSLEAGRKAPGRILALELNGESLGQQSQRELSGESELGGGPFRGRLSDN